MLYITLTSPNPWVYLVLWQVAHNAASARSLVNVSEGNGAPMLRAARGHATENKRLEASVLTAVNRVCVVGAYKSGSCSLTSRSITALF